MDQTIKYAVERLTTDHTVKVGTQEASCDPLITVLWQTRYPSIGRNNTRGGTGDILNMKAVDLYETLDGEIRTQLNTYRQHNTGDLIPLTARLYDILKAEDAGDRLEDSDRSLSIFTKWVARIEDLIDPPHIVTLTAPCPGKPETECGVHKVTDSEGGMDWPVTVLVRPGSGYALIAECKSCGSMWAGMDALLDLAETMGINIDWVTMHELQGTTVGVAVSV